MMILYQSSSNHQDFHYDRYQYQRLLHQHIGNVNDAIAEGKDIKIISFDELLKILNVTDEELSTMPFPDASSFYKKAKPRQRAKKKEPKFEKEEFKGPTLGDLFPDLFKKIKNENDEDK